jgi:hypothetical protein
MSRGRPTKTDIKKRALVSALEKTLGVVTSACKIVGVHRSMHYEWYNEDEEYRKQVDEISELTLDFAETQLHKQINEGNTSATIFFLKTKGKKRGYIERQEIEDVSEREPITVNIIRKNFEDEHRFDD